MHLVASQLVMAGEHKTAGGGACSQVRVVKAWAGARAVNDAANGTLNSYALTLLVGRPARSAGAPSGAARTGARGLGQM